MSLLSLVIPLYNENEAFPLLKKGLNDFCSRLGPRYDVEIVLVNDGSRDETWEQIMTFAREDSRVRGVGLSRNFGHQIALFCGYEFARGDVIVSMDGDLQDPPEVVLQMLAKAEQGADVVFGIRKDRDGESAAKLFTAHLFYRLLSYLGETRAPLDSGDFRLLSRRALNALLLMREKHKYLRGMVGWIGYKTDRVEYNRPSRAAGSTKFTWHKMLRFAADGIMSFSKFPLRLAFLLCLFAMLPFLGYLGYTFITSVFFGNTLVPGWTSLLLCSIVFGSLNLITLGILGEYIGRISEEIKYRPDYLVMDVTSPEVIPTDHRSMVS